MFETFKYRKESRAWQKKFDAMSPRVGDEAPDFELFDESGKNSVRLSDFHEKKPVVLNFGSYT